MIGSWSAWERGWIGPLRIPKRWTAGLVDRLRWIGERLTPPSAWLLLAIGLGLIPVFVDFAIGRRISPAVTALVGGVLLLSAAARDRFHPTLTCLVLAYVLHTIAMITLAAQAPQRAFDVYPPGEVYWDETYHWLRTGEVGVYDVGYWVPYHLQLFGGVTLLTYASLGLVPLYRGLDEIDLMNVYVGRYFATAETLGPGAMLAWHPWSMCRGIGYLFVVWEVTSLSLARLTGQPLSPLARRLQRWGVGIGLVLLDGVIKWHFTEPVRQLLASGLGD